MQAGLQRIKYCTPTSSFQISVRKDCAALMRRVFLFITDHEIRNLRWYCRMLAEFIVMHQVRITGEAQQRVWWYVQKDRTLAWRQMHLQSPRHFEKVDTSRYKIYAPYQCCGCASTDPAPYRSAQMLSTRDRKRFRLCDLHEDTISIGVD